MKIKTKFAGMHVLPSDITDGLQTVLENGWLRFTEPFETLDGVKCRGILLRTCNANKQYKTTRKRLSVLCRVLYGKDFEFVEEVWKSRCRELSGYWNLIRFELI